MSYEGSVLPSEAPPPNVIPYNPEVSRFADYHADYLNHPVYRHYLQMHKMCLGCEGSKQLEEIADRLSTETDPTLLSGAASAYLEAGIIRDDADTAEKLGLAARAEVLWEAALHNEGVLASQGRPSREYTSELRIAMNLACLPMVRAMFMGDVKPETIDASIEKLLQIGDLSELQAYLGIKDGHPRAAAEHAGLAHEVNALVSLLHRRDPKYIAIPSFQRSGTGYFYPEQTHDVQLISQHYGKVRNIIPIEVKSRVSRRHKERYRALILGGRAHLSLKGNYGPGSARTAYERHRVGEATDQDARIIDSIQVSVSGLLSAYKNTGKFKPLSKPKSHTTYYRGGDAKLLVVSKQKNMLEKVA